MMKHVLLFLILCALSFPLAAQDAEIRLHLTLDRDTLPADGRSIAVMTVTFDAPDELIDAVVSREVFFNVVGSGQFLEMSKLFALDNTIQVAYQAGVTNSDSSEVRLQASLVLEPYGRISAEKTLTLVREDVRLSMACAYPTIANVAAQPVVFDLLTSLPSNPGEYPLRVNIDQGAISTIPEVGEGMSTELNTRSGQPAVVYFTPPRDNPAGTTQMCVSISGITSSDTCMRLVWDTEPTQLVSFQMPAFVELGNDFTTTIILPEDKEAMGALGFRLFSTYDDDFRNPYATSSADDPWLSGQCRSLRVNETFTETFTTIDTAAVLEWSLVFTGTPVRQAITVIASEQLQFADPNASIELNNQATLNFHSGADGTGLLIVPVSAFEEDASEFQALVRVYVLNDTVDPVNEQLLNSSYADGIVEQIPASSNGQVGDMFIAMSTPALPVDAVSDQVIMDSTGVSWRAVYFFIDAFETALVTIR